VYSNLTRLAVCSERYQMCAASNILKWKNGKLQLTTGLGCQLLVMHPVYPPRMLFFFLSSFDAPCMMEQSLLNVISKDGSLVAYQPADT